MSDVEGNLVKQKSQGKPPMLQRAAITRRVDALLRAMSTDFLLREQFITDPSQVMFEYVYGTNLSHQKALVSNQLLYSVMSNPRLLGWLRDYAVKHSGNPPSHDEFASDFGRAVVDYGGHHVVLALVRSSLEKEGVVGFDEVLQPLIFGIFTGGALAAGTEMSTGTYATEQSGTHMSTGFALDAGTEMSTGTYATEQSGTHMSTGFALDAGTEMSTGTYATEQSGTHMSTGFALDAGTEMSTGTYATEQSGTHMSTGFALDAGTEMSTGTYATEQSGTHMSTGRALEAGTEMSTGTYATEQSGTHMSTGSRPDLIGSRYAQVTLEALAQYATQLREAGALDVIRSE